MDAKQHNITLNNWFKNEVGNVIYCKTRNKALPFRAIFETIRKIFLVDIIHYSSAYYYLTIYTLFLSVLLNKKVVLSPRGEFFDNAINNLKKKFVIKLYQITYKKILFHATSNEEKESILKLFPKAKIVIQPNFIQIETANKTEIKNKDIVFLGIIYGVKKIENIIKAISLSKNFDVYKSKFLIAGKPLVERDYVYKEKLENLITELNLNDKVEFVGEIFRKEKEQFYNKNVTVIGNPIRQIKDTNSIKREKVIVSVGRLITSKNFNRLIDIFHSVENKDWKLIIIGGDSNKQTNSIELKHQINKLNLNDRVILAGTQKNVEKYLLRSSIFAFTSSSEGFPNVIGEAMSAGLPVVAYDCIAGPSDMIKNKINGFLIPLFDDQTFIERLQYLINNKEEREKMGVGARESIKKFSVNKIGEQYYNFILQE